MRCPNCQSLRHQVIDKRVAVARHAFRRRRECCDCGHRFTTYEIAEKPAADPLLEFVAKHRDELAALLGGALGANAGTAPVPPETEA